MRKYLGVPKYMDAIYAVNIVAAFSAFVLAFIAMASPAWVTFVDPSDNWYQLGLFNACGPSYCAYAWSTASPVYTLQSVGGVPVVSQTWYYYDYTPALIATAQAFYIIGIMVNCFSFCWWAASSLAAALSMVFPAICYTIAFSCGYSFFSQNKGDVPVMGVSKGYAAACGVAALILSWVVIFVFLIDFFVRERAKANMRANQDLPMTPEDVGKVEEISA